MITRLSQAAIPDDGSRHLVFWCPGCNETHSPVVNRGSNPARAQWDWNGDRDKPTLSPSILVRFKRRITDDEHRRILSGERVDIPDQVCHSFVRDGLIQFLDDCTHALAGKTIALPQWPIESLDEGEQ